MAGEFNFLGPSADAGNATSATAFTQVVGGGVIHIDLPMNGENKNRLFRVYMAGRVQPGTTGNVTASVYAGTTAATVAGTAALASTGAVSCASNCSFVVDAVFHWNDDTDTLLGYQTGIMGATPTLTTLAVNTANISANPNPTAAASLYFVPVVLFGTSNASNHAYVDVFRIDLLA